VESAGPCCTQGRSINLVSPQVHAQYSPRVREAVAHNEAYVLEKHVPARMSARRDRSRRRAGPDQDRDQDRRSVRHQSADSSPARWQRRAPV